MEETDIGGDWAWNRRGKETDPGRSNKNLLIGRGSGSKRLERFQMKSLIDLLLSSSAKETSEVECECENERIIDTNKDIHHGQQHEGIK